MAGAESDLKNRLLTALCQLQIGVRIEDCLKTLCAENLPLNLCDKFDVRRMTSNYLKDPTLKGFAEELLSKMDELEANRDEIEEKEEKMQALAPPEVESEEYLQKTMWMKLAEKNEEDELKDAEEERNLKKERKKKRKEEKRAKRQKQKEEEMESMELEAMENEKKDQEEAMETMEQEEMEKKKKENGIVIITISSDDDEDWNDESEGKTPQAPIVTTPCKIASKPEDAQAINMERLVGKEADKEEGLVPTPPQQATEPVAENVPKRVVVWNETMRNYEKCYKKAVYQEFRSHLKEKGVDETWTAFYKRLFRQREAAPPVPRAKRGRPRKTTVSDPNKFKETSVESAAAAAASSTPSNSSNMPTTSDEVKAPKVRIDPTFWANRNKL
ncbi:unnamed protein product [Caenorhabditis sp. 36 PRJEB53466]|nr:unnamed protein product [Caenorhabditis sp. 36 PRJEB53466]